MATFHKCAILSMGCWTERALHIIYWMKKHLRIFNLTNYNSIINHGHLFLDIALNFLAIIPAEFLVLRLFRSSVRRSVHDEGIAATADSPARPVGHSDRGFLEKRFFVLAPREDHRSTTCIVYLWGARIDSREIRIGFLLDNIVEQFGQILRVLKTKNPSWFVL